MGSGRLTKKYLQLNHSMRQKLPKGFCKSKRSENRQFKKKEKREKRKVILLVYTLKKPYGMF